MSKFRVQISEFREANKPMNYMVHLLNMDIYDPVKKIWDKQKGRLAVYTTTSLMRARYTASGYAELLEVDSIVHLGFDTTEEFAPDTSLEFLAQCN